MAKGKLFPQEALKPPSNRKKHKQVWCVVNPNRKPLPWTGAFWRKDAVAAFLELKNMLPNDWKHWAEYKDLGYTVQKFYLVPVEESDE